VKDEDGIYQSRVIENSIRAGAVPDTQLLNTGRNRRHRPRQRQRELLALLQIKDYLAEFPPHVFGKASYGIPRLWVK